MAQATIPIDEATLDVLEARLYPRLEVALLETVWRERERVPPYFDEFIHSEIQRLEDAIAQLDRRIEENNTQLNQRFDDLRLYVDQRFAQVDQRFAQVDQRFDRLEASMERMSTRFRNWTLVAFTLLGVLITVLSFLLR